MICCYWQRILFLTYCFLCFLSTQLSATTFPFEIAQPLYVGARAIGIGNAFTAIADDATACFWNPAGLIQWQGVKVFGMNKFFDRTEYGFDPKGIAYSYRQTGFAWGNKIALGTTSQDPDYSYYALARQIGPYLSFGCSLKFQRRHPSRYYQIFGYNPAFDLAILAKPKNNWRIGLLWQNDLLKLGINRQTIGLAYQVASKMLDSSLIVSLDLERDHSAHGRPNTRIRIGFELSITNFLQLRAGNSDGSWTTGVGLVHQFGPIVVRLDYAWIGDTLTNRSHFISSEIAF